MKGQGSDGLDLDAAGLLAGEEGEGVRHGEREGGGDRQRGERGGDPDSSRAAALARADQEQYRPYLDHRAQRHKRAEHSVGPSASVGRHHERGHGQPGDEQVETIPGHGAERCQPHRPQPGTGETASGHSCRTEQHDEDEDVAESGQRDEGVSVVETRDQRGGEDGQRRTGRVLPGDVVRREGTAAQNLVPAAVHLVDGRVEAAIARERVDPQRGGDEPQARQAPERDDGRQPTPRTPTRGRRRPFEDRRGGRGCGGRPVTHRGSFGSCAGSTAGKRDPSACPTVSEF